MRDLVSFARGSVLMIQALAAISEVPIAQLRAQLNELIDQPTVDPGYRASCIHGLKSLAVIEQAQAAMAALARELKDGLQAKPFSVEQADTMSKVAADGTTINAAPLREDFTPFDAAAQALDWLADEPTVVISPRLWALLSIEERTELDRRATKRGQRLSNARAEGE
jgi:hypothetical protein